MDVNNYFLTQGVLGVLNIVQFGVIAFLYRELRNKEREHLTDIKTMQNTITEPLQKLQEASGTIVTGIGEINKILLNYFQKQQQ